MGNDIKTIHKFDYKLIREYFSNLERQGPGSKESTIKALSFIDNLKKDSKIIDLGCGTGGQTMVIADNTPAHIIGIDISPAFIDIFNSSAEKNNFHDRVKGIIGSMDNLQFKTEEIDLIRSEGSIYNIGFERGINEWYKFLKPDGYIAVSEASWFTEKRPVEIEKFWKNAYPEIDTISNKVELMQKVSYIPIATFVLPEICWIDNFYVPQVIVQENLLKKYTGNKTVEEFIAYQRYEAELYYKYKKYYGYVFYIGKKL
jgi:ubiquinone/menaquinone biosynthesis C-methylase UbiE